MTNIFCIRPKGFNVGNEAIHVALRHQLNQAFDEPVNVINLPATSRYESHAKAGFTPATVHELNQYGDGVIVGGGNLYENGELDVVEGALRTLDIPMMLYSLSMGRIYDRRGELVRRTDSMPDPVIKALHEQADISISRDEATVMHLEAAGAESQLGGCPTLGLDGVPTPPSVGEARSEVLITIRTPDLMSVPLSRRIAVPGDIRRIAAEVSERKGWRVKLLCHDHRDIPFAASFGDIPYLYTDDVYEYLDLLRNAELCITYRLHAAFPCFSFGTPTIKVSYDERGNSAMATAGLGDWNINLLETDDVVSSVLGRLDDLDGFERTRQGVRGRWDELLGVQRDALGRFADLVAAKKERDAAAPVA